MKIRYFSVLAVVSLLSLGSLASCSNPCAAQTKNTTATNTEVQANPCASKTNPCASKANPCASKARSIGGPLAKALQGKPVVVDIYASWCSACKNIAPTLTQLEQQYAGKVEFVVLDVTDKTTTAQAEAKAKELGLSQFLATYKAQTGTLTIVDPATGTILAQHRNNANLSDYTTVLDTALTQ